MAMKERQKMKRAVYHLWTFTISKFISNFGAQIFAFAVSFYILQVTGSASSFAINLLCNVLPRIAAGPFAGLAADRFSRKSIIILSHLITGVTILGLILLHIYSSEVSIPILYAATAIFSLASSFSGIAFTSSITSLVDHEQIQRAMSLNQMVISMAAVASPAAGGILYGFLSLHLIFMIYFAAIIIALILEATMDFTLYGKPRTENIQESMWVNMKKGFVYVKGSTILVTIISIAFVVNFFMGAFQVGYSYILIDQLKMPAEHFGIAESALAIGMLVIAIYMSMAKEFKYPLVISKYGILFLGLIIGVYSLPLIISFSYWLVFAYFSVLMFLIGASTTFINTPIQVMMQRDIDDEYKGRVFSIVETGAQALVPAGTLLFGVLYDLFPAPWIMTSSACLLMASVLFLARSTVIQKVYPEKFEQIS